jgi:hypothetical protein
MMLNISIIVQYIAVLTLIVGVIAFIYKTYRDSTTNYDQDTIVRLKESNDILRQENIDLKAKLTDMEARLRTLEQANEVLKGIVTGKDTFADIQKTLNQFLPYVSAFEEFRSHDLLIIKKLDELLGEKSDKRKKAH